MENIASIFDYKYDKSSNVNIIFNDFSLGETVIKEDCEFEKNRLPSVFPCMPPENNEDPFYYQYTETGDDDYKIAILWQGKKYLLDCSDNPQGEFTLKGMDKCLRPIQPNIFKMDSNSYRMYFWAHYHGTPRMVRFLMATSSDLHHWEIANNGQPILCHYSDILSTSGQFPVTRQCNDATNVYQRKDGSFEIVSASLIRLDADSKTRYYQKDLWKGYVRVIQRWTGDGLNNWSQPEIIVLPDENDPVDLQMYYLCINELPHGNLGLLGRYSVARQEMTIEPVWSFDRRHWIRPLRKAIDFEKNSLIVAPAHHMVEKDDKLIIYYTKANYDHNFKTSDNSKPTTTICKATIDKNRLFGLQINNATVTTPPLRLNQPTMKLYTSKDSKLDFVFLNAFGEASNKTLQTKEITSGLWEIEITDGLLGSTGRLQITGSGTIFDLIY